MVDLVNVPEEVTLDDLIELTKLVNSPVPREPGTFTGTEFCQLLGVSLSKGRTILAKLIEKGQIESGIKIPIIQLNGYPGATKGYRIIR